MKIYFYDYIQFLASHLNGSTQSTVHSKGASAILKLTARGAISMLSSARCVIVSFDSLIKFSVVHTRSGLNRLTALRWIIDEQARHDTSVSDAKCTQQGKK